MLIGELAQRTGASRRVLRYYERVGLLTSRRLDNGYRDFEAESAQRVVQIRGLLATGLPTSQIRRILPCARTDGSLQACPGVLERLRTELGRIDQQAADLARAQDLLRSTIARTEASLGDGSTR